MPVLNQTPLISYTGNGSVTVFAYPFQILSANDLDVYIDGSITTAYTLSGVGTPSGGNVTFSVAPATGNIVRIVRKTDISRDTDYVEGGSIPAVTLDTDFDRLVMMIQELDTISIKETSANVFDAEGKRIINLGTPVNPTDAANKSYLDSVTAAAAASAAAALASEVAAAATYDDFDDRYLGAKALFPALDNDGNALLEGAMFYHTGNKLLYTWTGATWASAGGGSNSGATGGTGNYIFYENDTHVTVNYAITAGKNAMSAGPITVDDGVTVTIESGSVWTIVNAEV